MNSMIINYNLIIKKNYVIKKCQIPDGCFQMKEREAKRGREGMREN